MKNRTVAHKGLEHIIEVEEARSAQGHRLGGWYLCRVYAPAAQKAFMPKSHGHPAFLWEGGSAEVVLNQIEDQIHADALELFDPSHLYQSATHS